MCNSIFVYYTTGGRVFKSPYTPPWQWTEVTVPNLPAGTLARPGVFVADGPYSRLFFGTYNAATTPPNDPANPGARVYYSDDCGATWLLALFVQTAHHVQAIGVDPTGAPANAHVYVSIGDTGYTSGLWYSSNGGSTSPGSPKIAMGSVSPSLPISSSPGVGMIPSDSHTL
jgi:hypothetical protein